MTKTISLQKAFSKYELAIVPLKSFQNTLSYMINHEKVSQNKGCQLLFYHKMSKAQK